MKHLSYPLADLTKLAEQLIERFPKGAVISLKGELGAGKTTLVRHVVETLYRKAGLPAPRIISPTFVIHQRYADGSQPVDHFDLYRLNQINDEAAMELGLNESISQSHNAHGLVFIEWASRVMDRKALGITHELRIQIPERSAGGLDSRNYELIVLHA